VHGSGEAGAQRDEFEAVYAAERAGVARLAFLLVGSGAVAEELAQEAFLRLYQRYPRVENPPGFLRTVVVRLAISWLRRRTVEQGRLAAVHAAAGADAASGEPELDEAWDALGRLRPEWRVVLVLRFYEDLSYERIAEMSGSSASAIRGRARRALAELRKEMSR
jgi:RNA polymerase sigma factor (sigma-70 family)